MKPYSYRVVNVFCRPQHWLSGNPLAVVIDEQAKLDTAQMQALALQFHLSETIFLRPPESAGADVSGRIFTPSYEMPFAGHPSLGGAAVAGQWLGLKQVKLHLPLGLIELDSEGDSWHLERPQGQIEPAPQLLAPLQAALDLTELEQPCWVNTGAEQLVVELALEALDRIAIDPLAFAQLAPQRSHVGVLAFAHAAAGHLRSRFFFNRGGAVGEDPGTGSATLNLGQYLLHRGQAPQTWQVAQGASDSLQPCHLQLRCGDRLGLGGVVTSFASGQFFF